MALQGRTALVGLDRLLELVVAALQALHQLLQLGQRLFKAQGGDVGRNGRSGRLVLGHSHASEQLPPRSTNPNAARVPTMSRTIRPAFYRRPPAPARPAGS